MATIRVTPEELSEQGKSLLTYADEMSDLVKNIDGKINEIVEGWDGLAQDSFYSMYQEMKQHLDALPELAKALGNATVGAAQAYADLDSQLTQSFSGNG